MKLSDYEFFPGTAIVVDDPKCLGRVKATVPTVFEPEMDKDGLPWVYPFTMTGYQSFSKMREGSKIWVFRNTKNHNEFWYMPMFELNADTREKMKEDNYSDSEIIMSRNNGGNSVYVYYNETEGIVIKYGDENFISINPDNETTVQAGKAKVLLKDNKVYVGDGNEGEPAVMGKKLKSLLNQLSTDLQNVASAASPNPYTMALATPLITASTNITSSLNGILAENTNVD